MSPGELRPMEWTEIVERGLRLWGRNFGTLSIVALAPAALSWLVQVPFQSAVNELGLGSSDPVQILDKLAGLAPWIPALAGVGILVEAVQLGALTLAISRLVWGEPVTAGEALRGALYRLPALFTCAAVMALARAVGLCACAVPGIFLALAFYVAIPAIVVEEAGPLQAIGRSFRLMLHTTTGLHPLLKGLILAVLVLAVLTAVSTFSAFCGFAMGMIWTFAQMAQGAGPGAFTPPPLALSAGMLAFQTATLAMVVPVVAIAKTLLFYDLRIREEIIEGLEPPAAPTGDVPGL